MRRSPKWAGRALVLAAALAAAGTAEAGEEPVPPLRGAVAASGPAASGGEPVPRQAGYRTGVAGGQTGAPSGTGQPAGGTGTDAGAVMPGAVSPASKADPTVPASHGGSRLLRALAERPVPGSARAESGAPAFAAEGCPRALLRRLLAGAAGEADALAALGIEREVLTLCRERQEIVTALFETEARLRELRAPAAAETASAVVPAPAAASAPGSPAAPSAPSPLRAALAAASEPAKEAEPSLGWFSIIGTAGALRAGITDGTGIWFVRAGDPLPGGGAVAAIAGRPPSVRATGPNEDGEESLPFRARPGGAP